MIGLAGQGKLLIGLVHADGAAAGDAALAHTAGHNGGVRGHTTADGEDALGGLHALDVLGRSLQTDQNHLLATGIPSLGVLGGKDDLAAGGAGRGGQGLAHRLSSLQSLGVKLGMQQSIQVAGINHGHGLLLGDHALVHQVAGDLQGGGSSALAVAALQHVELPMLHGELHILHVAIVIFQNVADLDELVISLGELLGHLSDGHGSTHAGHHVLALGVGQELAHELLLAGGGVTGKGNTGAAIITHIAKGHGLNVDGSAPGIGDVVIAAIHVGTGVIPGTEHSLDGAHQLLLRIGGEILADLGLVLGLELHGQLLQVGSIQLHVLGDALLGLHGVDKLLKVLLAHLHDHIGIHLDEAAVAIPGPTGIVGLLGDDIHHVLVQAQIQDGVHHTGHGGPGAGTNGDQQGILMIAELLAGDLLHFLDVLHDLSHDLGIDLAAILIVLSARLGGNGEALGNRQTDVGHLSQVGTLAAQQLTHGCVALCEQIAEFFTHNTLQNTSIFGNNLL